MTESLSKNSFTSALEIVTLSHSNSAILKKPAIPVEFPLTAQVTQLINSMKQFISSLESPYGKPAGLAAPQVGHGLQIILFQIPAEAIDRRQYVYDTIPLTVFINPSYSPINKEGKIKDWEGCYSVPKKMGEVYRYHAIQYTAYTPAGKRISGNARGFLARVLQHEIDHINGIVYPDIMESDCRLGPVEDMLAIQKQEREAP